MNQHIDELDDQYEDEWVAVVNKKVVAHGKSSERVIQMAMKATGQDRRRIALSFIHSMEAIYGQALVRGVV